MEKNNNSRRSFSKRNYYSQKRRSGRSRNKHRGEKISVDKYIAKAEPGFVASSIYAEDKFYEEFKNSDWF